MFITNSNYHINIHNVGNIFQKKKSLRKTLSASLIFIIFQFLWPAIRDGLRLRLGDKFGVDAELAWKHLYDYISCKLSEGIDIGLTKNKKLQLI